MANKHVKKYSSSPVIDAGEASIKCCHSTLSQWAKMNTFHPRCSTGVGLPAGAVDQFTLLEGPNVLLSQMCIFPASVRCQLQQELEESASKL